MNFESDCNSSSSSSSREIAGGKHAPSLQKRRTGRKKFRVTRHPAHRGVRRRNEKKCAAESIPRAASCSPATLQHANNIAPPQPLQFPASAEIAETVITSSTDFDLAGFDCFGRVYDEGTNNTTTFLDEEAVFNLPALLDNMAEGMLITPPAMKKGFSWDEGEDDIELITLWKY